MREGRLSNSQAPYAGGVGHSPNRWVSQANFIIRHIRTGGTSRRVPATRDVVLPLVLTIRNQPGAH